MQPAKLTPDEVKARMERGEHFVFVDARPLQEWNTAESKLPGAVHVPVDGISKHLKEIPWGHPVVSYCSSGQEDSSAVVAQELIRRGFLNTHPLVGGLEAWRKAGYPVEPK
jgi:rhodanese-related sulfurtransferase